MISLKRYIPLCLNAFCALALSTLLSSCFKEKAINIKSVSFEGKVFTADMGEHYPNQVYFNMEAGSFVDSFPKLSYDLVFDAAQNGKLVRVNGSKLMLVCHTGKTNIDAVSMADTLRNKWHVEYGSGEPDSAAIGQWWNSTYTSKGEVYLLNMGFGLDDAQLGYRKLQINELSGDSYKITFCNVDGSDKHTMLVTKKPNRNFVYMTMSNGGQVIEAEPDFNNWDIVFTQYSVYFVKERLPYKVAGVLTNPNRSIAYLYDSISDFSQITLSAAQAKDPANINRDGIGYTWKLYAYGEYTVEPNHIYIVKTNGHYYKLRFLSFVNSQHQNGYPKFEYALLK